MTRSLFRILQQRPLRWALVVLLGALVTCSNFAAAETKASSKTVCYVTNQVSPNLNGPSVALCSKGLLTTTEPVCGTDQTTHAWTCSVQAVLSLAVNGPWACGTATTAITPGLHDLCTPVAPAHAQTDPVTVTFPLPGEPPIPAGGREEDVTGQVCIKLYSDTSYTANNCPTWTHKIWLTGSVPTGLGDALEGVQSLAGYATTYAAPDPQPVVIGGP